MKKEVPWSGKGSQAPKLLIKCRKTYVLTLDKKDGFASGSS